MFARVSVALMLVAATTSTSFAITAKEKMETCKFGADDQKLEGAARKTFLNKCMAKGDVPGTPAKPKTAAKPAAAPADKPADKPAE